MVMALLAALTVALPDTGRVPAMEMPPGAATVATAGVSVPVSSPMELGVAEPRFERWRPPVLQASPGRRTLPLTLDMPGTAVEGPSASADAAPPDSQQARPVLVDYSNFYYTRLTIHKWASWAMLPLFGVEYYTGTQLYKQGLAAPHWERTIHKPVAATLAGLFALNTVTGVWNLWDGRKDPDGRMWRTAHGLLMLLADAGFVATGLTAPHFETESGVYGPGSTLTGGYGHGNERLHKQIAISSMVVATVSWVMMLPPFRRD
jgi:hypothetical protein